MTTFQTHSITLDEERFTGRYLNANVIANVSQTIQLLSSTNHETNDLPPLGWYTTLTPVEDMDQLDQYPIVTTGNGWYTVYDLEEHTFVDYEEALSFSYECAGYDLEEERESEVLEHWAVTEWFGEKLEEKGETVVYDVLDFPAIWLRTTSGQWIGADSSVREIMADLNAQEW